MKKRIALIVFALLALAGLIRDALASVKAGALDIISLGELWYGLDAPSLNLAQSFVQRYISPWVWDPAIIAVLQRPTWALPFIICLLLVIWRRLRP